MCGIIGYVGRSQARPVLVQGIRLLSYRGYDSAGIAVENGSGIQVCKDKGRIQELAPHWEGVQGETGIGHTRWATHGVPNRVNAHPQQDAARKVAVVHNGIIENDLALREALEAKGTTFESDTDTEVIAYLFGDAFAESKDPVAAMRHVLDVCRGAFAVALIHHDLPGTIVAVRRRSPLLVGLGIGENLVASDLRALVGRADRVVHLEEDQIAIVTRNEVRLYDREGRPVELVSSPIEERDQEVGKDGHAHFMHKEIEEQPDRLYELLTARLDTQRRVVRLDESGLSPDDWRSIRRIDLVACGTAHYASLYGAYVLEGLAGIPTRALLASEYETRSPVLDGDTLVIAVSQSGETTDTAAALEAAIAGGARTMGVLNVRESLIGRLAGGLVDIHAGPEIGVASTKAYTCMLGALFSVAVGAASARGRADTLWREISEDLQRLPDAVRGVLGDWSRIHEVAREIDGAEGMLYLGRGADAATALEGALKMKEISYIHAEGYPAGEMKHGPIALVSPEFPTVAVVTPAPWRERMLGNLREVRARDGRVIAVGTEADVELPRIADHILTVPPMHPWLAPIVNVIPLQMLAYETAKRRGCDIDQPRNLAKTVTVQ